MTVNYEKGEHMNVFFLLEKSRIHVKINTCNHHWNIIRQSNILWWKGSGGIFVEFYQGEVSTDHQWPVGDWKKAGVKICKKCGTIVDEIAFGEDWIISQKNGTIKQKLADGSIFSRVGSIND